ncbi:hypothetical protein CKO38_08400 [Rhodospirillum rubrum]|uniref:YihY/virulence factor BrkB family protein n=1 Tax=Rhodospirillum rubrum TaxID=1085 RepID=UPI001ED19B34|nr:YihY/virulence factor BrkB family protein [Rhodospirillum rubrum]MBK1663770.1 hypothetical protein [Rhodospirillum rubrum]MBK1676689.1 hypothetical protein [Rhodospirillum rubrum]
MNAKSRPSRKLLKEAVIGPAQLMADHPFSVIRAVSRRSDRDHVGVLAAGVAFFSLLASFPALVTLITLYGLFTGPQEAVRQIAEAGVYLPRGVHDLLAEHLPRLAQASPGSLGLGAITSLLFSIWSASRGMGAMVDGVDIAYQVGDGRGFVRKSILVVGLTLAGLVVSAIALPLIVGLPALFDRLPLPLEIRWTLALARWPLLFALVLGALAVLFRYAPDRENPRWRWVTPGALAAATLWILASGGLSLYVGLVASYDQTYGTLAGVAVAMMWLYLGSYAVLLGAEINAELEDRGMDRIKKDQAVAKAAVARG